MVQKNIFLNKLQRLKEGKLKNIETSTYQKKNKQKSQVKKVLMHIIS